MPETKPEITDERVAEIEGALETLLASTPAEAKIALLQYIAATNGRLRRVEAELAEAREALTVWRTCFEEITAKAAPISNNGDNITGYIIPAGPLHRAAGKTGVQAFNVGDALSQMTAALVKYGSHHPNCQWHDGGNCSCGWDNHKRDLHIPIQGQR